MRKLVLIIWFGTVVCILSAQDYRNPSTPVEKRVESMLKSMTLQEKLEYVGGVDQFYIPDIQRLGLPRIKMSDGPLSVRTYGRSTAYPAGIANAASWNKELVYSLGQSLGRDARSRGVHILLAPGVNIYRAPMCGRNFEYFGEDPYLSGQMAVQYIKGVQSKGVVATVKHFAANNQEYDRHGGSSNLDERTLQEIYLPAFRAAVIDGKVGAVMDAYNLLNGEHCTQNNHLNNEILKGEWKFQGILMSDWVSVYDGVAAAKGGLDLEMPNAKFMSPVNLKAALDNGSIDPATIDDKVRRILRVIFEFGFYDRDQKDPTIPADDWASDSVALRMAREGIVLLKNDHILPFSQNIKSIAVVGPNADKFVSGGGSSIPSPFHVVTVYQGIKDLAGSSVKVKLAGDPDLAALAQRSVFYTAPGSTTIGLQGEYHAMQDLNSPIDTVRTDARIYFDWPGKPDVAGMPADHFSVRWTGVVRPASTGTYSFTVRGDDGYRLWVNDKLIVDNWKDGAANSATGNIDLEAGKEYPVKLEYYENGGSAEITLAYMLQSNLHEDVLNAAKSSDVAVVCVGFNASSEGEGSDRSFALDKAQYDLINTVAEVNPNTVVVVNAGGNIDMQPFLDKVKGLVYAWYPGQEGGRALAEILFGMVSPSGKLPASFEKSWEDNPVHDSYYPNDGPKATRYNEGLFVGYRYYDSKNMQPLFPFGFGLSYTRFEYSGLKVKEDKTGYYTLSCTIKNTGKMAGAEAIQLYVGESTPKVVRPVKELKDFAKIFLNPGESKTVLMHLDPSSFAHYDEAKKIFLADQGEYNILVAASSRDIRLQQKIRLKKELAVSFVE